MVYKTQGILKDIFVKKGAPYMLSNLYYLREEKTSKL